MICVKGHEQNVCFIEDFFSISKCLGLFRRLQVLKVETTVVRSIIYCELVMRLTNFCLIYNSQRQASLFYFIANLENKVLAYKNVRCVLFKQWRIVPRGRKQSKNDFPHAQQQHIIVFRTHVHVQPCIRQYSR